MISEERAKEILQTEHLGDSELMELAKQMGAMALEKQIPKKATHPYEHCMNSQCPACGDWEWSTYKSQWKPNYCPKCGQALDWSDNE